MTKEDIIEMACQAFGGVIKKEERENFIAFAKLVAEKEREECAKIADLWSVSYPHPSKTIAETIRARGQE